MKRENEDVKKDNEVYKQFADGKIPKKELKRITDRNEDEFNELSQIRLKKIKIEKFIEQEEERESAVVELKPMSMKERLAMFEKTAKMDTGPAYKKTITVIDEGNVKELHDRAKLRNTEQIRPNQSQQLQS